MPRHAWRDRQLKLAVRREVGARLSGRRSNHPHRCGGEVVGRTVYILNGARRRSRRRRRRAARRPMGRSNTRARRPARRRPRGRLRWPAASGTRTVSPGSRSAAAPPRRPCLPLSPSPSPSPARRSDGPGLCVSILSPFASLSAARCLARGLALSLVLGLGPPRGRPPWRALRPRRPPRRAAGCAHVCFGVCHSRARYQHTTHANIAPLARGTRPRAHVRPVRTRGAHRRASG
jgi:hypothetical protein